MINKNFKRSHFIAKIKEEDKQHTIPQFSSPRVRKQSIIAHPKEYDFSDPSIFDVNIIYIVLTLSFLKTK
jgi:hypothetical protein